MNKQLYQAAIDALSALYNDNGMEHPLDSQMADMITLLNDTLVANDDVVEDAPTDVVAAERMKNYLEDSMAAMDEDLDRFYAMPIVFGFGTELMVISNSAAAYTAMHDAMEHIIKEY